MKKRKNEIRTLEKIVSYSQNIQAQSCSCNNCNLSVPGAQNTLAASNAV